MGILGLDDRLYTFSPSIVACRFRSMAYIYGVKLRCKALTILLMFLVLIALFDVQSISAASAGSKCAKAGVIQKTKGVTYTCARTGKLLKWTRKNTQQSTTTTSVQLSMTDMLLGNPPSPQPLSNCRLTDARTFKTGGEWQAITYPAIATGGFTNAGNVNVAVIFVDFSDASGTASELSEATLDVKNASAWYSWFSQGSVTYTLRIADRWVRAPKTSNNYYWLHPGKPGVQLQTSQEIAETYRSLAATVVDTSSITSVWVITPKTATTIDEGFALRDRPSVFSTGGSTYLSKIPIWQHFVHETLHSHGALGHSPKNSQIGLFWNTGSTGASLNSWDAMTLGWMKQENVYCVAKESLTTQSMTLVPIEREQVGLRSVIIKLSEYEALVIESHRKDKWSERWSTGTSGVSVMRVDTRIDTVWDQGNSTGKYLVPVREHSLDFLKVGQTFTTDGIKVTLVKSGDNDQIRIEPST
jgi:hypothetical protein